MIRIRIAAAFAALASLSACAAQVSPSAPGGPAVAAAAAPDAPVEVGVIAINDFHGALEPPRQSIGMRQPDGSLVRVPAGGAAWLASAVDSLKAEHPYHVVVAAGDLTSASQLSSSLFLDEPAVGVMNRIGVEFNAVGNHEFDRGTDELTRLQTGGCAKHTRLEPCRLEPFAGAKYEYLAASTKRADGSTLFPGTALKSFDTPAGRITLGIIGLSLRTVPELVRPAAVAGFTFADEADTINAAVPKLKAQGADAILVLIHQGGKTPVGTDPSACTDLTGDIRPILDRLQPGVDVVVSGHTHWQYVCDYAPASDPAHPILLTSAGVYGELVTDITLDFDPRTHALVGRKAHNLIVQSAPYQGAGDPIGNTALYPQFSPDPAVAQYVARYVTASEADIARPVGRISGPVKRSWVGDDSAYGGPLTEMIADSHLFATKSLGAQMAFTNPFGTRKAELVPAADGSVTFGQLYEIEPFNNDLIVQTMTGAQIRAMIEEGLDDRDTKQAIMPSANLRYSYDMRHPSGHRVVSLLLDGKPLDPARSYRVATNSFLSEGGDFFHTFAEATDKQRAGVDLDAFEAYIGAVPVRQVPSDVRAKRLDPATE